MMRAVSIDTCQAVPTAAPPDAVLAWGAGVGRHTDSASDADAYFDLGVALSTGSRGLPCDLIEAHKWFNIAASSGHEQGAQCRADLARDMTAREIADAQRRAREWLKRAGC